MNFKVLLLVCVILAISTMGNAQLGKLHKSSHNFKGRFGGNKKDDGATQKVTLAKTNPSEFLGTR